MWCASSRGRGTRTMGRRANGVYLTRGRTVTDVDGGPSHPMGEIFTMLPLGYVVTSYLGAVRAVWVGAALFDWLPTDRLCTLIWLESAWVIHVIVIEACDYEDRLPGQWSASVSS